MSPSRYRLRRVFKKPVLRVAGPFIEQGIHPNTITYLSLLFAFIAFLTFILVQHQLLYGILVFLVGFFDGVDGAVARGTGKASNQGAFIDSLIDKVAEALLLISIPIGYPSTTLLGISLYTWAYLAMLGWLLTSYSRSRAETVGVEDLDVGLGARSERLFTLCVFSVLFQIQLGLIIVTVMGLATALYRFNHYHSQLRYEG